MVPRETSLELRKLLKALQILNLILRFAFEQGAIDDWEEAWVFIDELPEFGTTRAMVSVATDHVRAVLKRLVSLQKHHAFTHQGQEATLVNALRNSTRFSHHHLLLVALDWIEQRANGTR